MNQQLESALKSAQEATEAVRAAHRIANQNGDEFASVYLLNLIGDCAKTAGKVRDALHAANMAANGGKL